MIMNIPANLAVVSIELNIDDTFYSIELAHGITDDGGSIEFYPIYSIDSMGNKDIFSQGFPTLPEALNHLSKIRRTL